MGKTRYIPIPTGEGGGGEYVSEPLNATHNGTYNPGQGVNGFNPVNVQVPASEVDEGTKQVSITHNGTVTEDVVGFANAEISVNVPAPGPEPYKGYLKIKALELSEGETQGNIMVSNIGDLQINKNGGGWASSNGVITVEEGDEVEFRGDNPFLRSPMFISHNISKAKISGNPSTLIQKSGCDTIPERGFQDMFKDIGCEVLLDLYMPKIVGNWGCYRMFDRVTISADSLVDCSEVIELGDSGFRNMFSDATIGGTNPVVNTIPVTGPHGCDQMFYYAKMKASPSLPSLELADSCYKGMFQRSNLETPPALMATVIPQDAYNCMFDHAGIKSHPTFPTKFGYIGQYAMNEMFLWCPFDVIPSFKAFMIDYYGCHSMYYGVGDQNQTNWYVMPEIEIDMMAEYACYEMFEYAQRLVGIGSISLPEFIPSKGCTNMFASSALGRPDSVQGLNRDYTLNFKQLGSEALANMFADCQITSLTINADSCGYHALHNITLWCQNMTSLNINTRVMRQPGCITVNNPALTQVDIHSYAILNPDTNLVDLGQQTGLTCNVNSWLQGTTVESLISVPTITWNSNDIQPDYLKLTAVVGTSITGGPDDGMTEYRINGGSWTTWNNSGITGLVADDEVEFRGENSGQIPGFVLDDTFKISGPLTTLQDKWGYVEEVPERLLNATFKNQPLIDATGLKWAAMTLKHYSFMEIFGGTQISNLPDIRFYMTHYQSLNQLMGSSTSNPGKLNIKITKINDSSSLSGSFNQTSISEMGTITIGKCGNSSGHGQIMAEMFRGCTSLTKYGGIEIGYNVGHSLTVNMFTGCTSLVNPGDITIHCSSNTQNIFIDMFNGCSSLTFTPNIHVMWKSVLDFTSTYVRMFDSCSSLTTLTSPLPIIQPKTNRFHETFRSMFGGCTSLINLPQTGILTQDIAIMDGALPTYQMFVNCSSLASIDFTQITSYVEYNQPFGGCTSLVNIKVGMVNPSRIDLRGVASTGTLHQLTGLLWTAQDWHDNAGLPTGWTVVSDL